jgi:biopolymer transport protein ExbD
VLHVEVTILCEAADAACVKFRNDIRSDVEAFAMIVTAGPSMKCRISAGTTKCSPVSARLPSSQQIYVEIGDDGTCMVDSVATPCLTIGKEIRAGHPSDDPKISVCGSATTKYDAVGRVLRALDEQDLPIAFGCPSHVP